jgi:hypothetical protein
MGDRLLDGRQSSCRGPDRHIDHRSRSYCFARRLTRLGIELGNREVWGFRGAFLSLDPSFSCTCKKKEAKETARVPRPLRGCPARRRHGRSTRKLASLKQSARLNPAVPPILGAGQREIQNQNLKNCFQALFEGASRGVPLSGRSLTRTGRWRIIFR